MDHDETGCQTPEVPILCINNCGFFGSAATMNMCSKCYRDFVLEQEQVQFAASSIDDIINQNAKRTTGKEEPSVIVTESVIVTDYVPDVAVAEPDKKVISTDSANDVSGSNNANGNDVKMRNEGPKRCKACSKRVGLTGFNCRCGDLFCALHRYSDKHNCPFDYRMAAQEAIAKANPIVKTEKLDRI